jgi:single-strand DNA-binding protein
MINQITINGNVGNEPELKMAKDETLAVFSLAHTPWSKTKGEGETVWFRVTFWNSKADLVIDSLRKGDKVLVIGKLGVSQYTDKEGKDRVSLEINGTDFAIVPKSPKNQAPVVKSVQQKEEAPW